VAKKEVQEIKLAMSRKIEEVPVEFITTGSTILNLAGSGLGEQGGWARNRIINIIGDGSSGKTILALETMANDFYTIRKKESKIFAPVSQVDIVCNNTERVMDFPLGKMYGKKFVDGVTWIATPTVEEFGADFARRVDRLKTGHHLLYVVDSWDALRSKVGIARFEKQLDESMKDVKVDDDGKEAKSKGTYGMDKQKYGSDFFGIICGMMDGKDVTLIIISQVREKINILFGDKYYRAGGKALDFYTHQCCWLAEYDEIIRTYEGRAWPQGIISRGRFKRNKVAKPYRQGDITILFDYGIDDLTSMINWLFGPKAKTIQFDDANMDRATFIKYVEDNDLISSIRALCQQEWQRMEAQIAPDRKPKFEGVEENGSTWR
jgi:RecA/RadA recombinase